MAFFFICVASFFTMVTFWKYMDFVWSIWNDKDFLQVQNEYCKRLCSVIQGLEKYLKDMEASPMTKVLNKNQCVHLYGKLILAMKEIDKMLSSASEDLKFQSIFEELCCLQKKVETIGKNCMEQDHWCHSVVLQLQNKETFRELLLDLKCCYNAARDVYLLIHPNQVDEMVPIQFDAATYDQVLEDGEVLKKKLELVLLGEVSQDYEMAQHLLLRLRNLDRFVGGDLHALEIPLVFKPPKLIKEIGKGSYGCVFKSNWLGLTSATKVLEGDFKDLSNSHEEASIFAGLSHPNLVQFFGCGIYKKEHQHDEGREIGEMHLVMELMESSLSQILRKAKRPLPYHLAIDIMHQIAKGVYYLHDMQVAHLDLKPDNVLSNSLSMGKLDPRHMFKITDYGTSQAEVYNNPEHSKPSKYTIGSRAYRAPEMNQMIMGKRMPLYPFQADVWSFAMICSEILSGEVPYSGLKPKDFTDKISCTHGTGNTSLRPVLPNNCKELTNLIVECWAQDPLQRPTFSNICERLRSLEKSFLMGTYSCKMVPQFVSSFVSRDSKSIMDHVLKMDKSIAPPKDILVGLDHQISKVKGLSRKNYVGIVGPGGIGKTTLAKAIFDDVTTVSSYDFSYFIANCKNYQSSYEILCNIISKLGIFEKPKNLGEAQQMMKDMLVVLQVLLVLDDIKDEAQVHDIVPLEIVQASNDCTIILTTRDWRTIQPFVDFDKKLEVESLDEKAATTLFITHLSWGIAPLSPDFENLCKHIVKACNGLPLSLKVMGSFLRNKKRLRNWERALRRMARGRNLDGDEELWNTLKMNFGAFNNDVEKSMFLDMACFFYRDAYSSGISKETLLYMWSRDGILPLNEFESLVSMSLLKINEDGKTLEMHDQLHEMGRRFAKNTRIWDVSMIPNSGFTSKDVEVLEGISWQGTTNRVPLIGHDNSIEFKNLRVLILVTALGNVDPQFQSLNILLQIASLCPKLEAIMIENFQNLIESRKTLPANIAMTLKSQISKICDTCASLKILDFVGLGFLQQLPNKFASRNTLLRLNLSSCSRLVAMPKEVGSLLSLKTLNLSGCASLTTLLKEIGNLSSLTTLNLSACSSLTTLPEEVGNLSSLTKLDLSKCSSLAALPKDLGNFSSLIELDLSKCLSLAALPKEVGKLSSLTRLDLSKCTRLATLPKDVGNLSSLTKLDLSQCSSLAALPKEVGNLSSLTELHLTRCSSLAALPKEVGKLSSLIKLDLSNCTSLAALPNEISNLSSLTKLDLSSCSNLATLPKEVGNLSSLTELHLSKCSSLVTLPKEVGNLSSLTKLYLSSCSSLAALPKEVGSLSSLTELYLRECSSLAELPKEVGNLSSMTMLYLSECSSLTALPKEVENLTSLTELDLSNCSSLAALPKEVRNLPSLRELDLSRCSNLAKLPKEVGNLSSLTKLDLSLCSRLTALPKEVANLSSLTKLYLGQCSSLAALPKEMGNLSSLTELHLFSCSSLTALPKEVGNLLSLTKLGLSKCSSLTTLPKEVGKLSSLTELYLSECSSLAALPKEVWNLSSLTTLYLPECSSLGALLNEVRNLSSLTTLGLFKCSSLAALPKEVGKLSSLTKLDLSECLSLAVLPKEVGNLSSLTELDLSKCLSLAALPKEVGNLSSLTKLYLSGCSSLAALPKEVWNLSFLKELDLSECSSLAALPKEVGNLSSLTKLYLTECSSMAALPKTIENLSSLTELDLSNCSSLETLPKEVGNLSSLTKLYLGQCSSLAALPKEMGNLSSLTELHLFSCSSLTALPKEVGNLLSLTKFDLSKCSSLATLPKEVGKLSSLTELYLSECSSLAALPKEVWNLSSLTMLYLPECSSLGALLNEVRNWSSLTTLGLFKCSSLAALPKEVGKLSSLTKLDLSECSSLAALPKEVGKLSSLMELDLSKCLSLAALPKEVGNLSSLTNLYLTPKGPNSVFWQHSDFGQLATNGVFIFFL